ncbi:MAG: polysaccharide biosynthesis tyrosine autokinase [Acidimicrobiales bacterium]|nr:polysaccharide biosynthesis tyrosine autokinase [Acidimicrobiales bacterium]
MESAAPESSVLDYARIVWRRKWLIAAAMIASVSVSLFVSARATPIYSASSRLLIASQDTSLFAIAGLVAPDPAQIDTQVQVITSPAVAAAVAEKLGADAAAVTGVTASGIGTTRVLDVTVRATSPAVAAEAATAYAEVYTQQRRDQAIADVVGLSQKLAEKTVETKQKIQDLESQITRAQANRASTSEIEGLRLQRDAAATTFVLYQQKADQAAVDASVATGGAEILVRAAAPSHPVSPQPRQSAALALALGLMLGVVAAIALDFLDDSVKTVEEVERIARNLPILGAIPTIPDWRNRDQARLMTIEDSGSVISEAYRSMRTNVQFAGIKREARCLQISSPVAAEGKTTTLANLAVTLALSGRRVTVVDCDLRRPRVHEFFGVSNEIGFTSVLLGDQPLSSALQRVVLPDGAVIQMLASGPLPPNPAELLGTTRVAELIAALKAESDYVLIDAPPVLPVTDAVVLASRVDGVMLVATCKVTGRRHLNHALNSFRAADSPLIGVIVNGAPSTTSYSYDYSYRAGRPQSRGRWMPDREGEKLEI